MTPLLSVLAVAREDPSKITDDDLAGLTDEEREIVALAAEVMADELENHRRQSVDLPRKPPRFRLSDSRMAELCVQAREPGFSVLRIPIDEWKILCANHDQMAALNNALGNDSVD